jgi:exosortase D (VPLPA-CTERM-specific)
LSAWQRPEYSHGYLIPIIAAIIALKRFRDTDVQVAGKHWLIGFAMVVLGILLGFFGILAGVSDITTYGMFAAIAGMGIGMLGTTQALNLWPAWVYLGFMLPLPNFLYWPLSIKLQFLSSKIGVALIKLMGVPVYLEGNIIDLGVYQLQVAEACSGLRYLFPLMSFGFLFATIYRGPTWHKVVIFLATAPITVLMNSARIAIIGYLVNAFGIAQAEGFLHFLEGWVIFGVCVVLLFFLTVGLQKLTRAPQPISEILDFSIKGLAQRVGRIANMTYSRMLLVFALMFTLAAIVSSTMLNHVSRYPDRRTLDQFPSQLGSWSGSPQTLNWDIERVLAADDYLMSDFLDKSKPDQQGVNLLVSYYRSQTEGSGIHSPEVCIPAGGWEVSKWEQIEIALAGVSVTPFKVNQAIIQKERERQLVYYWFEQRGRRITNDYVAKAFTVWDSVTLGRSDGALIRVITPIVGNDVSAAQKRLNELLVQVMPRLPDFVPG